jgi:hypothetical protein
MRCKPSDERRARVIGIPEPFGGGLQNLGADGAPRKIFLRIAVLKSGAMIADGVAPGREDGIVARIPLPILMIGKNALQALRIQVELLGQGHATLPPGRIVVLGVGDQGVGRIVVDKGLGEVAVDGEEGARLRLAIALIHFGPMRAHLQLGNGSFRISQ